MAEKISQGTSQLRCLNIDGPAGWLEVTCLLMVNLRCHTLLGSYPLVACLEGGGSTGLFVSYHGITQPEATGCSSSHESSYHKPPFEANKPAARLLPFLQFMKTETNLML